MNHFTNEPIDTNAVLADMGDPHSGAVVLFVGTTRQFTQGNADSVLETDYLLYDAYQQMALKQMQELEETAKKRWAVQKVTMVHRLGRVDPMEPSVAVAVSCPHRSEAFEAARWLIDELKHQVPIWKQEHYVQQGSEWIHPTAGNCSCQPSQVAAVSQPHLEQPASAQSGPAQSGPAQKDASEWFAQGDARAIARADNTRQSSS